MSRHGFICCLINVVLKYMCVSLVGELLSHHSVLYEISAQLGIRDRLRDTFGNGVFSFSPEHKMGFQC